jgi:hypothetical protein
LNSLISYLIDCKDAYQIIETLKFLLELIDSEINNLLDFLQYENFIYSFIYLFQKNTNKVI